MKLIWSNIADTATATVSPSAVATLPVTNLQQQGRSNVWRSTSTADQTIRLTWATPQPFNAAVLYRTNVTSAATWRIKAFSDAAWTTNIYDSGSLAMLPAKPLGDLLFGIDVLGASVFSGWSLSFAQHFCETYYVQSLEIIVSDPTNTAGYVEAARLYVGAALETDRQFSYGLTLAWRENTRTSRTDGGTLRTDRFSNFREMYGDVRKMSQTDRSSLTEVMRRVGMHTDVFITAHPGVGGTLERDHAFAAKFLQMPEFDNDWPSRYTARLTFGET